MNYVKNIPIQPDRGSAFGRALLERRAVHIPDVKADPEYTLVEGQRLGDYRSVLAVPMVREGNAMRPWFAPLTTRQAHVSELVAVGMTNTEIARHLGISVRTTDAHVSNIFYKLDLHRRKQLADWVLRSRSW